MFTEAFKLTFVPTTSCIGLRVILFAVKDTFEIEKSRETFTRTFCSSSSFVLLFSILSCASTQTVMVWLSLFLLNTLAVQVALTIVALPAGRERLVLLKNISPLSLNQTEKLLAFFAPKLIMVTFIGTWSPSK